MRRVTWEDRHGYMHASLVRDSDPDEAAEKGIPIDPPDLARINWEEVQRELHNELVRRGLFTYADVQRAQNGVTLALQRILRRKVIELYKLNGGAE